MSEYVSDVTSQIEFDKKYVFNNYQLYTVINPLTEDYTFKCTTDVGFDQGLRRNVTETREYSVPAGGSRRFPGPVAGLYLDQMAKIKAQRDKKFAQFIDYSFRDEMYQTLIADQEDLINNYREFPQYEKPLDVGVLNDKPSNDPNIKGGDGVPFAEAKNGRAAKAPATT